MDEDVRQQEVQATEQLAAGPERTAARGQQKATSPERIDPKDEPNKELRRVYDALNGPVAGGKLPGATTYAARLRRSPGYLSPVGWVREDDAIADAIWLNSKFIREEPLENVFALLAGLMMKQLQYIEGTEGCRVGYGNRDFADRLKAIGLQCSHTGEPGGREVGDSMRWYIIPEGPFEKIAAKLKAKGLSITWKERLVETLDAKDQNGKSLTGGNRKGRRRQIKYVCPASACALDAKGKPGLTTLGCLAHGVALVPEKNIGEGDE